LFPIAFDFLLQGIQSDTKDTRKFIVGVQLDANALTRAVLRPVGAAIRRLHVVLFHIVTP
jgi:hypothetical protein